MCRGWGDTLLIHLGPKPPPRVSRRFLGQVTSRVIGGTSARPGCVLEERAFPSLGPLGSDMRGQTGEAFCVPRILWHLQTMFISLCSVTGLTRNPEAGSRGLVGGEHVGSWLPAPRKD